MTKQFTYHLVGLFLVLVAPRTYGQTTARGNYWLSVGLGKSQFPSGMVALGYERADKPTLLTARYVVNRELFADHQPGINASELGLLYGIRAGKFRFSAGVSGVWGTNRGAYLWSDPDPLLYGSYYYQSLRYTTLGIPAEIRFITATKDLGIGLTGFGNWNGKRSFAGLNLSLYLGKMK